MKPLLTAILALATFPGFAAEPFPQPFNTGNSVGTPPMSAAQSASQVNLPPGFHCSAFAGEPDVQQPIAMATDSRGRLWVAENYTYSERTVGYNANLRDRIVVFEDSKNTGHFDKRTVFWDGAERLTSVEVGFGGVWALCPPQLLFIPDRNGDGVQDGKPVVILDGFEFAKSRHTIANGLRWGPDGWLYGRHGIQGTSLLGAPGTPPEKRVAMNVGIWRYHPQRKVFEVVAEGTTNPWGMDWDAHGESFFINTVIGHLWHIIPGAHYRRMYGEDPNPRLYDIIEQHADHVHWATGEVWTDVRKGVTDATLAAGGGHAHTGLIIYQGGQWPEYWNGKLLTVNFHGRQLNVERMERTGSGFVGKREPDAFRFADPWFRGLDLIAAPDGGVYINDWSDTGECHDSDGINRLSGRIFKLTYGESKPRTIGDLATLSEVELAKLQLSPNDWLARQSRLVLADRAAQGQHLNEARAELQRVLAKDSDSVHRLRALWALHVSGGSDPAELRNLLADRDEYLRAWAIRLWEDQSHESPAATVTFSAAVRGQLLPLAAHDSSGLVRLTLTSLLQKLALPERTALAAPLLSHAEDSADHNMPLMLWYGIEPLVAAPVGTFEKLIAHAGIPRVQRFGARRLADDIDSAPARLDTLLTAAVEASAESRKAILDGISDGLTGRRKAPKPSLWDSLQAKLAAGADQALRNRLRDLSALFGSGRALDEIRAAALDPSNTIDVRRNALQMLVESRAPDLRETCTKLLHERELSGIAATGLALSEDPALADLLIAEWPRLNSDERSPVMSALVSRPAWAGKALDALADGRLAKGNISAFNARQIRAYHDPVLAERLDKLWGKVRDAKEGERAAVLAKWKPKFSPDVLAQADKAKGRATFQTVCAVCHTLNGEGAAIGPDLTGAARDNLDYLLDNILFPSAVVPDQYKQFTFTLKDGRSLAGMIRTRSPIMIRLQTMTEVVSLPVSDVAQEEASSLSMMPEGLLDALDLTTARNLIAYLMTKQ